MEIILIRHGITKGNRSMRYIGRTDEPLSPEGIRQAEEISPCFSCHRVFVTPLLRTQQTASILFPGAEQVIVRDFREMDFGDFENRTAEEMAYDKDYRAWVEGGCTAPCPNGENLCSFSDRVCKAFSSLVASLLRDGEGTAVLVVHGGTIMSILERFAVPKKPYFDYWVKNCGAYRCFLKTETPLVLESPELWEDFS